MNACKEHATILKAVIVIKDTKARSVKKELTIVKMIPVTQQAFASRLLDITNVNVKKDITTQLPKPETAFVS